MTRIPALILLASLVCACGGDDGTGPEPPPTGGGSLSFDVSGDRQGRFTASGRVPSGTSAYGTWSAGAVLDTALVLVGSRARTSPRVDLFFLVVVGGIRPGTYPLDAIEGTTLGFLLFDVHAGSTDVDSAADAYVLTTGTVTVTQVDEERARGAFTGDGIHLSDGSRRIFVRGGSFDVPLEDDIIVEPAGAPR